MLYHIYVHNNDIAFHDFIAFLSSGYSQSASLPAFFMHKKKSLIEGLQIVDKLDENINWAIPNWYFHFLFA